MFVSPSYISRLLRSFSSCSCLVRTTAVYANETGAIFLCLMCLQSLSAPWMTWKSLINLNLFIFPVFTLRKVTYITIHYYITVKQNIQWPSITSKYISFEFYWFPSSSGCIVISYYRGADSFIILCYLFIYLYFYESMVHMFPPQRVFVTGTQRHKGGTISPQHPDNTLGRAFCLPGVGKPLFSGRVWV